MLTIISLCIEIQSYVFNICNVLMGLEHEVIEDNGYILTKLVNMFWMSTVSGIGMQQIELLFTDTECYTNFTKKFTKHMKIEVEYQGM